MHRLHYVHVIEGKEGRKKHKITTLEGSIRNAVKL